MDAARPATRLGKFFRVLRGDREGTLLGMTAEAVDAVTAASLQRALRAQGFVAVIITEAGRSRAEQAAAKLLDMNYHVSN